MAVGLRAAAAKVLETYSIGVLEHHEALNELERALEADRKRVAQSVARTRVKQKEQKQ